MKILFLDIDGVLNSTRSCVALGGYPHGMENSEKFDWIAVKLLQRFCDSSGVQIVLSSAWRILSDCKDVGNLLGLPIIDATPKHSPRGYQRGWQIQDWLDAHSEVEQYAIIDDDSDMLPSQMPRLVKTNGNEGLTWEKFVQLCSLFGESAYSGEPRGRNAILAHSTT